MIHIKNLIIVPALAISLLSSCSSDNNEVAHKLALEFPQKWTLIEMSGNIANVAPKTGADMSWQEYYVFNSDMTFSKVRDRDGVKSEADGTYDSLNNATEKYLQLTYMSGLDLVGSCTSGSTETLLLVSDAEIASTWLQCDGPGLRYAPVAIEE